MDQSTLQRVVRILDETGIPYMVTGSMGSMVYGEPRMTNDLDIVIDPTRDQLRALLELAAREFIVFEEAAWRALEQRGMFNILDRVTGEKVDLICRKDRAYSREEFARRVQIVFDNTPIHIVAPEDSILSKLEWAKKGESDRQRRDALGMILLQRDRLDWTYLRRWAAELGVADLLERLLTTRDEMK